VVWVLGLEPMARSAGFVPRSAALGHDALEAELAGVLKHDVAGAVEMLAQLQAGLGVERELSQCGLAILDRLAP
jgi:hypothetical protein